MNSIISALQDLCVFVMIAYLLARIDFFFSAEKKIRKRKWIFAIVVFAIISCYGAIVSHFTGVANYNDTRIVGIVLAGFLCAYIPSLIVLIFCVIVSLFMKNTMFLVADMISMVLAFFCCRATYRSVLKNMMLFYLG